MTFLNALLVRWGGMDYHFDLLLDVILAFRVLLVLVQVQVPILPVVILAFRADTVKILDMMLLIIILPTCAKNVQKANGVLQQVQ